jgi:diamine N-acetyltransferase
VKALIFGPMNISISKAGLSDIPLITSLAKESWNIHYPSIISQEQIDYMLGEMYSAGSLSSQMNEKGHLFLLVLNEGATIGFLSVSSENKSDWFLHKFYILAEGQQKGIGTRVFEKLLGLLDQPASIRLTVNRLNFKSINFYFKNGFTIEKTADFDIGNNFFMNDFVMLWKPR